MYVGMYIYVCMCCYVLYICEHVFNFVDIIHVCGCVVCSSVSLRLHVKSLRLSGGASLDNAAGSLTLSALRVVQEAGCSFSFGCTFTAEVAELFLQQGTAEQRIYSASACTRLTANADFEKLGYFVQSPNLTVAGVFHSACM